MSNDLHERIRALIDRYQESSHIKRAQNVEEELEDYETVPKQEPEVTEFTKEMDRILAEHFPSSVSADEPLDEEDQYTEPEEVQEDNPGNLEVQVADEENEEVEPESPIAVGEEALEKIRKEARKLSDRALIQEFHKTARKLIEMIQNLEKTARFVGAVPALSPQTPEELVTSVIKQANTDADLVANYIKLAQEAAVQQQLAEEMAAQQAAAEAEAAQALNQAALDPETAAEISRLEGEIMEAAKDLTPEEIDAAVEQAAAEVEQEIDEEAQAEAEVVDKAIQEAVDEFVDEYFQVIDEAVDEVIDEFEKEVEDFKKQLREQGRHEEAEKVDELVSQYVAQVMQAEMMPGVEMGVPVVEGAVPVVAEAPVAVESVEMVAPVGEEEASSEKAEEPTKTEKSEEESEEAEETKVLEELSSEETVNELGNALEDMGITPEELVNEAKDEEARKQATIIARAVTHLKRARRYKRVAAVYDRHRKLRNAMKDFLLELIS